MKLNVKQVKEKIVGLVDKIGKKTVIIAGAVFVIALAVILNFILLSDPKEPDKDIDTAIDLSDLSGLGGEESATETLQEYFSAMALSRQQSRDEAIEVLKAVAESETAVDEMKEQAIDDITEIARYIEKEANIETMVMAKGFAQCLAIIDSGRATVIVESNGLLPNEVAQISEIVYTQSGILPSELTIIEKSSLS